MQKYTVQVCRTFFSSEIKTMQKISAKSTNQATDLNESKACVTGVHSSRTIG